MTLKLEIHKIDFKSNISHNAIDYLYRFISFEIRTLVPSKRKQMIILSLSIGSILDDFSFRFKISDSNNQ